jgi:hypothetical protein
MNKTRRIGAMVAATVAATGMAMTVTTAPAAAAPKPKGPTAVWSILKSVNDNTTNQWVSVSFQTDVKVCNFKLRVWDWGKVDVTNPWGLPFTRLWGDDTLKKKETDFASFKVSTGDYLKPGTTYQILPATIYYDTCGKKAKSQSKNTGFLLPVKNMS